MSYFEKLRKASEELTLWADLRHEQGEQVTPQIKGIVEHIRALIDQFKQMPGSDELTAREPDDLEAILAARPDGPRKLINEFPTDYAERVKGAFLARAAGCTLGAIVENWPVKDMQEFAAASKVDFPPTDYWPVAPAPMKIRYLKDRGEAYTRSKLAYVPVDDDVTYTLLGLLVLERYGPNFTTADVAEAWLEFLPMACTAEEVTLANLKAGIAPGQAGETNNPYIEWIGADIRSDPWGYAAPGAPERAAGLAFRDAFV